SASKTTATAMARRADGLPDMKLAYSSELGVHRQFRGTLPTRVSCHRSRAMSAILLCRLLPAPLHGDLDAGASREDQANGGGGAIVGGVGLNVVGHKRADSPPRPPLRYGGQTVSPAFDGGMRQWGFWYPPEHSKAELCKGIHGSNAVSLQAED